MKFDCQKTTPILLIEKLACCFFICRICSNNKVATELQDMPGSSGWDYILAVRTCRYCNSVCLRALKSVKLHSIVPTVYKH